MADLKEPPPPPKGFFAVLSDLVWTHGTFYRLHLTAFTLIPLISAAVFYACNGRYHVSFLDSLFLWSQHGQPIDEYGLRLSLTIFITLSPATPFQQVILYLLMVIGDITAVSWIVSVLWYFKNVCQYMDYQLAHRHPSKSRTMFLKSISSPVAMFKQTEEVPMPEKSSENPTFQLIQPTPAVTMDVGDSNGAETVSLAQVPTTHTVNFAHTTSVDPLPRLLTIRGSYTSVLVFHYALTQLTEGVAFPRRTATVYSSNRKPEPETKKYQGKGGFPGPVALAKKLFKRGAPTTFRKLERKMTMPYTETLAAKKTPWLSFDGLVVGRNSAFRTESLSDEQVEFIGGVEYRALRFLSYLIPAYFVGTQLFAFILFAPWLSATNQYDAVFTAQPKLVQKPCGMLPFQSAYLMIFGLMFVILAGNHALRSFSWIWSKIVAAESETGKTLSFLLQHPRRFPSHQTWFLFICLVSFSTVEWVAFEVLGDGTGPRVVDGLFQGLAARASGLAIVPLASASPALQFLYVVMMYIAVAMTIRSTNVYESESLGVFEEPPPDEDEEPTNLESYEPRERVGRYLLWHLDRQMSIDIWWLVWGVFLVAVIERHNLLDEDKKWFDLFRIVFELVSAFGGIGLSLGFPDFSGALGPLSKLVIIVIMVRGRH
ncbi:potassium transporter, partial [Mycena filopes]